MPAHSNTITIDLDQLDAGESTLPLTWDEVVLVLAQPDLAAAYPWRQAVLGGLAAQIEIQTTPKPEEPTGLGAVVKDRTGEHWVRAPHYTQLPWHSASNYMLWLDYAEIDVVEIVFPGVTL